VEPGIRIGYYRQDFSTLDLTPPSGYARARMREGDQDKLRSTAAGFLLDAELLRAKIGALSEGQKGLVAFAKLSLEAPGCSSSTNPPTTSTFDTSPSSQNVGPLRGRDDPRQPRPGLCEADKDRSHVGSGGALIFLLQLQTHRIDAIPLAAFVSRTIVENVAEVRSAVLTNDSVRFMP